MDGSGTGNEVHVTSERAICAQDTGLPPISQVGDAIVLRQFLTDDGTATGSTDMRVNGSTTEQEFYIGADATKDTFITSLSFVIADSGANLNQFGNISALTNGCKLRYVDVEGEVVISDQLTTNWEFVRLCQGNPAFGSTTNAFRASNVSGNSEGYIPFLDLRTVFGLKWGIRLRAGTLDKVSLVVRDNVTGVDQFDCIAYGFKRVFFE